MITKPLAVLFAATLFSTPAFSQTTQPTEDFKPSSLNQPGQEYPQVNSQGYARFRINAPKADSVKVSLGLGGRGGTRLTKGADGFWTGTTEGPMDEGFHYYNVTVDGGKFNDPRCQELLRVCPLGKRHRDTSPRPGILRPERRAARPCAADSVSLQKHGYLAPGVCVHPAGL